jgi:pyridoxal phosphate enzyme (YggS family)
MVKTIKENLTRVKEKIEKAADNVKRDPKEIKLVAVSKTMPVPLILEAIEAGVTILGENRVQEAEEKIKTIGHPVSWHLIGHLQSNKAKKAASLFDVIHSIDSLKIAKKLNAQLEVLDRKMDAFIELNLGAEETKYGMREEELIASLSEMGKLPQLRVVGLMAMPPFFPNPEDVRPYFRRLRELKDKLNAKGIPGINLSELSMGMSHDFEVAIEEGATFIRVGTAIFGPRKG